MLRNFDFLGQEPQFYISKMSRYKTCLGGVISILTLIVISGFALYFSSQVFSRSQMSLLSSQTSDFNMLIDFNKIPLLFLISTSTGVLYNTRTTYPILQVANYYPEYRGAANITTVPFKPCNSSDIVGYEDLYDGINLENYLCLNRTGTNLTLWGNLGDLKSGYSKFSIYSARCTNNSIYNYNADPATCLPTPQIEKLLSDSNVHIYMSFPDNVINYNDATKPLTTYLRTEDFVMPLLSGFRHAYQLKNTFVHSDLGFVFEDFVNIPTYQVDSLKSTSYVSNNYPISEAYGSVNFQISPKADVHKRTYIKLQVLCANIGGIVNFVYIVAHITVTYFTNKSLMLDYVNNNINNDEHFNINVEASLNNTNVKMVNYNQPHPMLNIKK
jgi:hypothetical protein